MKASSGIHTSVARRAEELFNQHRLDIFKGTDRLFARLMLCQWLAGIVLALCLSPQTWAGETSQIHIHVWAAIFLGGILSFFPIAMTRFWAGSAFTRYSVAVGQTLTSALLISITGGRIETHFHVFGSLVILSFYRDWRVLIPATVVVALDHFVRGVYWPYSVYGVLTASPWRSMEHAGWVIFEDIFLVISCLRSVREMRSIAIRTAEVEASEKRFRTIFEEAPVGMAVVGLDHRFEQVNARLCQMVGYTEQELTQLTPAELAHGNDPGEQLEHRLLDGELARCTVEKRYVRKDKEPLWVTRTTCLVRDQDAQPRHYLTMIEDITAKKRAAEELLLQKTLLESQSEASIEGILVVSAEGKMLSFNRRFVEMWGISPEVVAMKSDEAALKSVLETVADPEAFAAKVAYLYEHRDEESRDEISLKDGRVFDRYSAPIKSADRHYYGRIWFFRDVTESKRSERALQLARDDAEQANRAKSEFLSRMSHELRTPLNAILGFAQLLERQKPTEVQRGRIVHIVTAGRHLLDLINEVLDLSSIEAGRLQLSLEPVRVSDAFGEAVDLILPIAAQRHTEIISRPCLDETRHILADRQRLKQVLLNLLTNAIKYSPEHSRVTLSCEEADADRMQICVSDNGQGIPGEKLQRLFLPFDRLDAEQSDVQGTGLGLSLSKRLMEAMGGGIGVTTEFGSGSTFWIDLPNAKPPSEHLIRTRKTHAADSGAAGRPVKKRKVLYIEDNLSNLALIEQMLTEQPEIELISAMQGRMGLQLASEHLPNLILLDLHLPDLPGWEVLAQLKSREATQEIPVVIVSADATARQIDQLMKAGARSYLTKPLNVSHFFEVIEQCRQKEEQCVAA